MPEEHEGYAAILRALHPRGEPRPSAGLAAQLFGARSRPAFLDWTASSNAFQSGALKWTGGCRSSSGVWTAEALARVAGAASAGDLAPHLEAPNAHGLRTAEHHGAKPTPGDPEAATVHDSVTAESEEAAPRGLRLAASAGRAWAAFQLASHGSREVAHAEAACPGARGWCSSFGCQGRKDPWSRTSRFRGLSSCARSGAVPVAGPALIAALADQLTPEARRSMWSATFRANDAANRLAARYPVEHGRSGSGRGSRLPGLEAREPTLEDGQVRARGPLLGSG
jgi:hypothetical protein